MDARTDPTALERSDEWRTLAARMDGLAGRSEATAADARELVRLAVNLRGAARAAGLDEAAERAARLESLLGGVAGLTGERLSGRLAEARDVLGGGSSDATPPDGLEARLHEAFRIERGDHLTWLRNALANAGRGGELDAAEFFRRVHSLKGAARACGLERVEALAARLQEVAGALRAGALSLNDRVRTTVESALETLERIADGEEYDDGAAALAELDALAGEDAAPAPEADGIEARLRAAFGVELAEHLEAIRGVLERCGPEAPAGPDEIQDMFRRAHSLKGAARACGLERVSHLAHRLEDLYAQVRDKALPYDAERCRAMRSMLDAIEDAAAGDTTRTPEKPASVPARPAVDTMRVRAEHFDRILDATGQVLTECLQGDRQHAELEGVCRQADLLRDQWDDLRRLLNAERQRSGADRGLHRLTESVDRATAAARRLARRAREAERRQRRSAWTLRRHGLRLQDEVRGARMTPAESVFSGIRKMVRDLARAQEKQVECRLSGLQVKADRLVLQALKDPVMHMVRNALSHGIEPPDERRAAGKPETGVVELRLRVSGNRLHVSVHDDGRGIDRRRVLDEAVRSGRVDAAHAANLDDESLGRLLFLPGFTTRTTVSDLAGRGMGLSVVHEAVARLQGEVEWTGETPGTTITLAVPLAVSTYRMLLVASGAETYALPLAGVERLLRVEREAVHEVEGRPMVDHAGRMLVLAPLPALLGRPVTEVDGALSLVVLRAGSRRGVVAVDRVVGERDALLKNPGGPAAALPHVAGAILLEDGSVALVLQPSVLLEWLQTAQPVPEAAAPASVAREAAAPRVLIVDDSFTTRTLETGILESRGFQVSVAVDGLEALEVLRATEVDLVVCDIEMPRLDGFGLLRELKASERLARLPVIMVSSRDSREDRLRGLELGADAYIVKQRFDHDELLQTIRQILA